MPSAKTMLLLCTLIGIVGLTAFRPGSGSSIVGVWTQFEVRTVTARSGGLGFDTTIKEDRQYTVTFTADSQYRYSGPRMHPPPGSYSVRGDLLQEMAPSAHYTALLKIVSISDRKLILQIIGPAPASSLPRETTITYKR